MKYQIVVTGGKILVRQRRFFKSEYLRRETGKVAEFASEQDAINCILARSNCEYCYAGAILREIKTEDYYN